MHMTIPVWVLLAFAGWTLLILSLTVGVYRWARILTGRSEIREFHGANLEGTDFYVRAMRAHVNCIENLPVYGAIVLVAVIAQVDNRTMDTLALTLLGARVVHSLIHVSVTQTNFVAAMRWVFFFIQFLCMIAMGIVVASAAWPP